MALALLVMTTPAEAQGSDGTRWGAVVSFTPEWHMPSYQHQILDADVVTIRGDEYTVGVSRGRTSDGDWGVLFIRRRIDDGGLVRRGNETLTVAGHGRMVGAMVYQYDKYFDAGPVEIGASYGIGVGSTTGGVQRDIPGLPSSRGALKEVFGRGGKAWSVVPLARYELMVGAAINAHLKFRAGLGVMFPGHSRVTISAVVFP
jgi:hypothetical protein